MDKEIRSEKKDKPVLTEETFSKLLEAAYVLQEHNRRMREMELSVEPKLQKRERDASGTAPAVSAPKKPSAGSTAQNDYTPTLAQIVETQHSIQLRQLKLEDAMALVAERVTEIAKATGAAIGILDSKKIRYRAAAGAMALPVGTEVSIDKALCASCLKTGQVFRSSDINSDVNSEFLIDSAECHRRGIQAMIAVPIFHEGGVAGGLELYYATAEAFSEQDVHTSQLMAGLVTEALARNDELTWKQSLASERAAMLEALEKIKPNLAALADVPQAKESRGKTSTGDSSAPIASPAIFTCSKCGNTLVGEEQFCGKCGLPRTGEDEPPDFQSRLASFLNIPDATKETPAVARGGATVEKHMPDLFAEAEPHISEPFAGTEMSHSQMENAAPRITLALEAGQADDEEDNSSPEAALAKTGDWSSAASARNFLEQLAAARAGRFDQFWRARRGDIYLAIAVILMALVIRWAIWSDHSVGATGTTTTAAAGHKKAPDADLPLLDRMLIGLGLAEAPPPPETKGNPETQVWVDLQTALYYCPGTDLYGKTPKGKFATQRDAQLDQFEPAYRKACE